MKSNTYTITVEPSLFPQDGDAKSKPMQGAVVATTVTFIDRLGHKFFGGWRELEQQSGQLQ